jgi:long-chain fatty acid transport protein
MRTLVPLAVLAIAGPARADDSNFRPYIVGARAAGMGGAYTALADDGSGPYYNPAGIAFAERSSLSLSASVYGLVSGTIQNALGTGHDFNYSDLNTFPVSTAVVRKLAPDSAIAFSVFVPDAFRIDDRDSIQGAQNAFFLSDEIQTVWAGLTYARRFGKLGIGASAFGLLGSETQFLDLTAAGVPTRFVTITTRSDISTKGVVGAVGLRYDVSDQLHLGLSVYSPELGTGTRRQFIRVAQATDQAPAGGQITEIVADDLHATPALPVRVQGGIAWSSGALTLAADAILLGPRAVHDDLDREGLDRNVVRHAVVDGSIGAELVVAGSFPIRIGAFTDFAATKEPEEELADRPDPNASNTDHVDRYGATFSLGYRTANTATTAGVMVSYGAGHDVAPNNLDFSDLVPTTWTQTYAYLFIASTYEF